jgi:hypothetical protein
LEYFSREENRLLTLAICFNQPAAAIAGSLYLPEAVYERRIPILVKQNTPYSILSLLEETNKYRDIKPFGMLDNCLDISEDRDLLPMQINYVYNYYFAEETKGRIPQTIPDIKALEPQWITLETALKWSNRFHANMQEVKLRSLIPDRAFEEQLENIAEVEHNRWNIEKLLMGYRPFTPEDEEDVRTGKTTVKKLKSNFIHRDIRAYGDLPEPQKLIDHTVSEAIPLLKTHKNQ